MLHRKVGDPVEKGAPLATLYFSPHQCLITLTRQATLYLTRTIDFGYRDLQENAANPHALSSRLALEIQRSMDYYEQHFRQAPIRTIAILPLPVTLYGLEDVLQQTLGLATRIVTMRDVIGCTGPVPRGPEGWPQTASRNLGANRRRSGS